MKLCLAAWTVALVAFHVWLYHLYTNALQFECWATFFWLFGWMVVAVGLTVRATS